MSIGEFHYVRKYTLALIGYMTIITIILLLRTSTFYSYLVPDLIKVEKGNNLTNYVSNNLIKRKNDILTHREKKTHENERPSTSNQLVSKWMENLRNGQQNITRKYFLSEILKVRIYKQDKAKWTIKELKQWLHYMLWAGVEHIYLCDHYVNPKESVEKDLHRYIRLHLITYVPFSQPRNARAAQVQCYKYILSKYKQDSEWQMTTDMDEYPFIHNDTNEAFLARYLKSLPTSVSVVYMPNFLMLGQGDRRRNVTIDRINRIHSLTKESNELGKNIYKPQYATDVAVHSVNFHHGSLLRERGNRLKMLHYWGARLQNWGPDTPKIFNMTVEFNTVRNLLAPRVRKSLLAFGETSAFSNTTGP